MGHKRTCYEDFCESRALEMAFEIIKIFYAFGLQLNLFMSAGIWLSIFVRCSNLSEVRQCRIQNADSDFSGGLTGEGHEVRLLFSKQTV